MSVTKRAKFSGPSSKWTKAERAEWHERVNPSTYKAWNPRMNGGHNGVDGPGSVSNYNQFSVGLPDEKTAIKVADEMNRLLAANPANQNPSNETGESR
mgnify:CR=1 FL=1